MREVGADLFALLKGSLVCMAVPLFFGLPTGFTAWLVVNAVLIVPLMLVAVVGHETAHVLAAVAVGMKPYRVAIGAGRTIFEWRAGGVRIDVHALLFGGLTFVGTDERRWLRLRWWIVFAAGPLSSLLLALLARHLMVLAVGVNTDCAELTHTFAPATVFWYATILTLAGSIVPMRLKASVGELRTDAWMLLTLPFCDEARLADCRATGHIAEAIEDMHELRWDDALACCDRAAAVAADSYAVSICRGTVLMGKGDFGRGRDETMALLSRTPPLPFHRLVALNNIAWADLLLAKPDLLGEADKYSAEAIKAHPQSSAFQGTRALLLIQTGRIDEGIKLGLQAFRTNLETRNRAANACSLAIGFARKGKRDEAGDWIETARELDPQCLLLPRAVEETDGERIAERADTRGRQWIPTAPAQAWRFWPRRSLAVVFLLMLVLMLFRMRTFAEEETSVDDADAAGVSNTPDASVPPHD
jgi:hypothetical protein